ncbi:MAG: hypothetical protein JO291_06645 [Acidimicrobiia bacterium]|nr:hypothetical protein [Acidimicrobiia bacterium]
MRDAECAVVVNVRTDLVATLALASAATLDTPVLLVNCEPTEASRSHFAHLQARLGFRSIDAPIRSHGETLDRLFRTTLSADRVFLLDSDAEVRDAAVVEDMCDRIVGHPKVYGAGWLVDAQWLDERRGATRGAAWHAERPWMPCVMFRTDAIRAALEAGHSFAADVVYNDLWFSRRMSAVLARRFQDSYVAETPVLQRLPRRMREGLRRVRLSRLAFLRADFDGVRPNYVMFDTGADIHRWCRREQGLEYAIADRALAHHVSHYDGVTRAALHGDGHGLGDLANVDTEVRERLARYGIDPPATPADPPPS